MKLSHLPTGVSDADIERQAGALPEPPKPGVYRGMPDEQYQAIDALRASDLPAAALSMAHLRERRLGATDDDTDARAFGRLFHAIAEGDDSRFLASDGPVNPKTGRPFGRETKAYADWLAEQDAGREIVPMEWHRRASMMVDAVRGCPACEEFTSNMEREITFIGAIEGVLCKARVDCWGAESGVWSDYKTTSKPAVSFPGEAARLRYPLKAAFQARVIEAATRERPRLHAWIVVESFAPHGVRPYTMQVDRLLAWNDEVTRLVREVGASLESGEWPGYPSAAVPLVLPRWAEPDSGEEVSL